MTPTLLQEFNVIKIRYQSGKEKHIQAQQQEPRDMLTIINYQMTAHLM